MAFFRPFMVGAHYVLNLKVPEELRELYTESVTKYNRNQLYSDAGFDLFCPTDVEVRGFSTQKIYQGVQGAMEFFEAGAAEGQGKPVGYYMYPRSSTATKTPLRLANSVGVIDSGYRGHYIAVFDNWRETTYKVERLQRLVQICPPNLSHPLKIVLVDNLDMDTERGTGGFGSTGR